MSENKPLPIERSTRSSVFFQPYRATIDASRRSNCLRCLERKTRSRNCGVEMIGRWDRTRARKAASEAAVGVKIREKPMPIKKIHSFKHIHVF